MFCSTVIASINRSTLSAAVQSVLDQDFANDDFEVIVVNDTGRPLPEMDWVRSERVKVVDTCKRKSCVARNTGAAVARGKYCCFLDDDNLMLPGALQMFWKLHQESDAVWLYGGYETMDDDGNVIETIQPQVSGDILALLMAGEWIPIQTSLFRTESFFLAGAFDTSFVSIAEDIDLGRRLALLGSVVGTTSVVARIRGSEEGSSANWSKFSELEQLGREKIINQPHICSRLSKSAQGNSYLRGRVARAYLASAQWNLNHANILVATSRLTSMLALSGPHVVTRQYWRGLRRIAPL